MADEFAQEYLIPGRAFEDFVRRGDFSKEALNAFAGQMKIDTGIVVGRLQKEGYIKYDRYNDLKTKYRISRE